MLYISVIDCREIPSGGRSSEILVTTRITFGTLSKYQHQTNATLILGTLIIIRLLEYLYREMAGG